PSLSLHHALPLCHGCCRGGSCPISSSTGTCLAPCPASVTYVTPCPPRCTPAAAVHADKQHRAATCTLHPARRQPAGPDPRAIRSQPPRGACVRTPARSSCGRPSPRKPAGRNGHCQPQRAEPPRKLLHAITTL